MNIEGKIALVTGAATGIGAAIAEKLSLQGAIVIGADIAWKGMIIDGITQVECDVADPTSINSCFEDIQKSRGGVDILVNNAAIAADISPKPFEEITSEEWKQVMTTNTLSQFLCCKAAIPHMREKKWGRIINLTSGTAFVGIPFMLHYVASKGAITAMTRSLSTEVGNDGITVNAIAPGLTLTQGIQSNSGFSDEMKSGVVASRAIKRDEYPEDVTGLCSFLASEDASFITGQIIVVDGGATFH